jgi:uncharacterized protein YlzI (FlbEa/FlbD family)
MRPTHEAIAFALIMLTQLDGSPVWVESTQVQVIKIRANECGPTAKAVIRVLQTTLCVKESADQVREKIESSNNRGKK